jgi:MraZ protein
MFKFQGISFHVLDGKGRIAIPNRFRQQIRETCEGKEILILTQGFDKSLLAFLPTSWEDVEKKAEEYAKTYLTDKTARKFIRRFVIPAAPCILDKLGRIMIPQNLREYANIKKNVVIAGAVDKIEILAKEEWEKFNKNLSKQEDIGL